MKSRTPIAIEIPIPMATKIFSMPATISSILVAALLREDGYLRIHGSKGLQLKIRAFVSVNEISYVIHDSGRSGTT